MNLQTAYLGLDLRSPLVASPSPLTGSLDTLRQLEDAGAGAVVLPSLFEEQLRHRFHDPLWSRTHGIEPYPAELSYLPEEELFRFDPEGCLELVGNAASALEIPVIASLSGAAPGEWTGFAREMEAAGAAAIELSIYHVPSELEQSASEVEDSHVELVEAVRGALTIPLAVKLCPFFTSLPHFASRLIAAGADGLVLFNRLFSADVELEHGEFERGIRLTTSRDLELALRWMMLLHDRVKASLAATGGAHTAADALKLIFAGADVVMLCSALLRHGAGRLADIEREMSRWLEARGHVSLRQARGCMDMHLWGALSERERANYIWAVGNFGRQAAVAP
jgi:dihydroorotate dehydrogenase (fumarate)